MSQPTWEQTLSGFNFSWPDHPAMVTLGRIQESSRGTRAELIVKVNDRTITHQTINLLTSKARLAKELASRLEGPWDSMLEQVCVLTLRSLRQGAPIESLQPTDDDHPAHFILNPLLYQKNTTVLYGPGDSFKSFFALYCSLLLTNGQPGPHLAVSPEPWKVLWLDWEMSKEDVRGRVKLLQAGDPRLTRVPDYRRCCRPLAEEADDLRAQIADGEYDVLVIDSLGLAAGGRELERADAAIDFFNALRGFDKTSLIIGHTPKDQDGKERAIYGSVYFRNTARVCWEVRREGQTVGLYQTKNNLGARQDALGWSFEVTPDGCAIAAGDLFAEAGLASKLPLQDQIAQALKSTPGMTVDELSTALNAKRQSIKAKLNACKTRFIGIGDGKWECLS